MTLPLSCCVHVQENTRLQSKVLRFDMGVTVPPQPAAVQGEARVLMDELKEENLQLRDDNDKLVEYLEKLEARLGSGPPTPAAQDSESCRSDVCVEPHMPRGPSMPRELLMDELKGESLAVRRQRQAGLSSLHRPDPLPQDPPQCGV